MLACRLLEGVTVLRLVTESTDSSAGLGEPPGSCCTTVTSESFPTCTTEDLLENARIGDSDD